MLSKVVVLSIALLQVVLGKHLSINEVDSVLLESANPLPYIATPAELPELGTGTCVHSQWQDVPRDCGESYCEPTGWFNYKFEYNEGSTTKAAWTNMYYPFMTTYHTSNETGYYYAFYTPIGYTGFQPKPNGELKLIFSSFSEYSYVVDSQLCSPGADYGSGTSCKTQISGLEPYKIYYIRVTRTGHNRFAAHVLTNEKVIAKIGEYAFMSKKGIRDLDGFSGFIEDYVSTNHASACCQARRTDALIFAPFSTDFGNGFGKSMNAGIYGSTCNEEASNLNFTFHNYKVELPNNAGSGQLAAVHLSKGWVLA